MFNNTSLNKNIKKKTKDIFVLNYWGTIKWDTFMPKQISALKTKLSKTKKSPNDYPKFAFRLDLEKKESLIAWVDKIYYLYQDRQDADSFAIRKNDIILEALTIGLQSLEDKIAKKSVLKKNLSLDEWKKRNKRNKPKDALF